MSEPICWCETCGRSRSPYLHMRSKPPPTGAKKWLKKTCPITYVEGHEPCNLKYQAGISPALRRRLEPPVIQEDES